MTREERREIRHTMRKIWFWSMLITVMWAAMFRRQPWYEIEWYWTPITSVMVNAICTWLGEQAFWGRWK